MKQGNNFAFKDFFSVVLPCRNEEASLEDSILNIKHVFKENHINGEIIVSDSSLDNSPQIARKLGVTLVEHGKKGYGIACREGIIKAKGTYVFIADPDGSYDFNEIPCFLKYLKKDYDFVIGNRLTGTISKGAMSWTHRYIGNPVLSYALKILFNVKIGDAHCGMRAIRKETFMKLNVKSSGWEFASDMVIKARINNLRTKELSINYFRRKGTSKLNSFPDGVRQMFFIFNRAYLYYKKRIFI